MAVVRLVQPVKAQVPSTGEIDAHVGARLRSRRLLLNRSQESLAQMIGVSVRRFERYETGVATMPASQLWALAQALGAPLGYFYEGLEEGRAVASQAASTDPEPRPSKK